MGKVEAMQVLSTRAMNTLLASRMGAVEAQIQRIEQQVASGQKANTFAELGSQAAIDIALHNEAKTIETYRTSNQLLIARMKTMDQAMLAMHDAAESVKNEAYAQINTDTQRTALIAAAKTAFDTVVNRLQTSVGGRALFGGTQTATSPMQSSSTLLDPAGLQTNITNALAAAPPDKVGAVLGEADLFFDTATNFYQGGPPVGATAIDQNLTVGYGISGDNGAFRDILEGLAGIILTPKPNDDDATVTPTQLSRAEYATIIQNAAGKLASGVGQLRALISSNGSNQARVETTNEQHETTLTLVQSQINDIEQTDMISSATRLSLLRTQLEATYTITGQIGQLSLVNYLRS